MTDIESKKITEASVDHDNIPSKRIRKTAGKNWGGKVGTVVCCLLVLGLLFLTYTYLFAKRNFGAVPFDQIVFHIMMPLSGTSSDMIKDYVTGYVLPFVSAWMIFICWVYVPVKKGIGLAVRFGRKEGFLSIFPLKLPLRLFITFLAVWFCILFFLIDRKFSMISYLKSQLSASSLIEEEYIQADNVAITFPDKKRNLICIYIESAESSSQDMADGGLFQINCIPELTELARENTSFSQSDLIEGSAMAPGTEWTIAGLVAETAGIPLFLPLNYNNVMGSYKSFLPGVKSLGEILADHGYHNYFMSGSNFEFGGRTLYFTQHGNYNIMDYKWALKNGMIPEGYHVFWGMEDQKLFQIAKEQLLEIAKKDEPFNFSLLTVDTHTPNGYVCELCKDTYSSKYMNVWACASSQISSFVRWIQEQDFYENTTIFLSGDHISMHPDFYGANSRDDYVGEVKRKVYECFVNPAVLPIQEKNRKFTTMDMFPSILGALGVQIEGNRLGLGTDLFSGEETLPEKYGYSYLFTELGKRSIYYERELLFPK